MNTARVKYLATMAFKEFGVLLMDVSPFHGGYNIGLKLIINENDIFQVRFQPSPQGPYMNPTAGYAPEFTLHDIVGQELGERTLLYHSERPFRIDDLAHTIGTLESMEFWKSTGPIILHPSQHSGMSNKVDEFVKEVKYRQAKNDRIEELEKQIVSNTLGRRPFGIVTIDAAEADNTALREQLERDNKDLQQQVTSLRASKEAAQRTSLQSGEMILSLKKEIDAITSLYRNQSDVIDNADKEHKKLREEIDQLLTEELTVAEEISPCACLDLKFQVQSLKLQLAAEKRISQKYARDLQERDKQQATLTAM